MKTLIVFFSYIASILACKQLSGGQFGYDQLSLEPRGVVFEHTFDLQKKTTDGKFCICDTCNEIPLHANRLEIVSDLAQDWQSSVNTKFWSLNAHASLFSFSGGYSMSKSEFRSHAQNDDVSQVQASFRGMFYAVISDPLTTPLSKPLYDLLHQCAQALHQGRRQDAYYTMQVIQGTYGNVVLNKVIHGGVLAKTDLVSNSWVQSVSKETATQTAGASFGSFFGVSGSYSESNDNINGFSKATHVSRIITHGGRITKNTTVDSFISSMLDDGYLVPVDGTGVDLMNIISLFHLQQKNLEWNFSKNMTKEEMQDEMFKMQSFITIETIKAMQELYIRVFNEYLDKNLLRGCKDKMAPNYDPRAFRDDGSCRKPLKAFTFFGAYQTCPADASFAVKNPLTNDYTCSPGFLPVSMSTAQEQHPMSLKERCGDNYDCYMAFTQGYALINNNMLPISGCIVWWWAVLRCNVQGQIEAMYFRIMEDLYVSIGYTINTVFCVPKYTNITIPQGYDIVHFYADQMPNFNKSCPEGTFDMPLFGSPGSPDALHLCLSDNSPDSTVNPDRIPFGGVTTCTSGNPFVLGGATDPRTWPNDCPPNYSRYSLVFHGACRVMVCFKTPIDMATINRPLLVPPYWTTKMTFTKTTGPADTKLDKAVKIMF